MWFSPICWKLLMFKGNYKYQLCGTQSVQCIHGKPLLIIQGWWLLHLLTYLIILLELTIHETLTFLIAPWLIQCCLFSCRYRGPYETRYVLVICICSIWLIYHNDHAWKMNAFLFSVHLCSSRHASWLLYCFPSIKQYYSTFCVGFGWVQIGVL